MPDDLNDGAEAEVNGNFSTADAPAAEQDGAPDDERDDASDGAPDDAPDDEQGDAPEIETLADLLEAFAWDIEGTRTTPLVGAALRLGFDDWPDFDERIKIRRNQLGAALFEFLVERTRTNPGAPLTPWMIARLRELRSGNAAEFERLRARLKDAGCRVGALDREMNRASGFAHQRGPTAGPNAEQEAGTDNWPAMCDVNKQGEFLCNLRNALIVLRNDPEFVNHIALDEMRQTPVVKIGDSWHPLRDDTASVIQEKLQEKGLRMLGRDTAFQAIAQRASERPFHPVRDYLRSTEWDGVPRLDSWLEDYCSAEVTDTNREYLSVVGRTFFLSLVARVERPGCKVDHIIILEGAQGTQKTTAAKIIGGEWFTESLPPITSGKEATNHLRGKWLVEMGELAAMSKAEAGQLKQFITVQVDKFRPHYGRTEVEFPRQCVFIGTTNDGHYLRDPTGARRFFPVKLAGPCDADRLGKDRDKLFAEAFHRFQQGEKWWPDAAFQREHAQQEQASRFDADAWEEKVAEWLRDKSSVTVACVLTEGLGVRMDQISEAAQKRVQKILRHLGWQSGGWENRKRVWVPGADWHAAEAPMPVDQDDIPF